jgi:hypothetical protein
MFFEKSDGFFRHGKHINNKKKKPRPHNIMKKSLLHNISTHTHMYMYTHTHTHTRVRKYYYTLICIRIYTVA